MRVVWTERQAQDHGGLQDRSGSVNHVLRARQNRRKGFKQGSIGSNLHFRRLILAFLCGSGSSLGQRDQVEGERW